MSKCSLHDDSKSCTKLCSRLTVPVPPAGGEHVQRYEESWGEGGGVYPNAVGSLCDYFHVTRLQAEVKRLHVRIREEQTYVSELAAESTALQSELTKTRELLTDIWDDGELLCAMTSDAARRLREYQSAPAATAYTPKQTPDGDLV